MEVVFHNRREDFEAFYDYTVKETEQGKRCSRRVFFNSLLWIILVSMLFGALKWGASGRWQSGLATAILCFFIGFIFHLLVIRGVNPIYNSGMHFYRSQENFLTHKDLQVVQLPKTIMVDDDWLEIRNSEAVHRWRWRQVDQVRVMSGFTFIHVGNCPVIYVPKRDFPSEQSFLEFGKKLVELKEKDKDQLIGTE